LEKRNPCWPPKGRRKSNQPKLKEGGKKRETTSVLIFNRAKNSFEKLPLLLVKTTLWFFALLKKQPSPPEGREEF
jgi:hypothetical protein